jgi:3-keto-5-aminohexanoate cleavage enzyme
VEHDAAIITVGLNEGVTRTQHEAAPWSPKECGADARRCADAGASIVHWHARDPMTGEQRLGDTELYAAALDEMRPSGVLSYPSYPIDVDSLDARLGHCWTLGQHHGLELAPLDVGSVSIVTWDQTSAGFGPAVEHLRELGVIANPLPFLLDALARMRELGLFPVLGSFDLGFTRTATMLAAAGHLPSPMLLQIFLSEHWAAGPHPTEQALDLHLAQLPSDLDVEWVLVPYASSNPEHIERLCRYALERGGGIRIGIGDSPAANPGCDNAKLVEQAAGWAAEAGRPIASPDDVRRRLGIPLPEGCGSSRQRCHQDEP